VWGSIRARALQEAYYAILDIFDVKDALIEGGPTRMLKTIKMKIRQQIIAEHKNILSRDDVSDKKVMELVSRVLSDVLHRENITLSEDDKHKVIGALVDELTGFGPVDYLFKDPEITEIMINGANKVYVERNGKKELTDIAFDDEQQLHAFVYRILAPTRRRVDESFPYTDVSMKDGARVNIIIPPLALDGPTITIRKFLKEITLVEDLIARNTIDRRMADFLIACIKAKVNMMFSGATGSGKTTTLAVLSSYLSEYERIVTIEDTAELHLAQDHVVRLETRPPNIEGKGEVTIRDLFRNSLRMRPGRIILGEVRGAEALDVLQAMCSGHRGALAVVHASSPQDVVYRLETMALTSGLLINLEAIRRQIAAAINLIIQQEQLPDGTRKITHLTQINGLKGEEVVLDDIFYYEVESVDAQGNTSGRFKATGVIPVFYKLFTKAGINLPVELFTKDE